MSKIIDANEILKLEENEAITNGIFIVQCKKNSNKYYHLFFRVPDEMVGYCRYWIGSSEDTWIINQLMNAFISGVESAKDVESREPESITKINL